MANIVWTRRDIDDGHDKAAGKYEGSPTLSQNFTNFGPQTAWNRTGVFTYPHYYVPLQFIAHPLIGINVAPNSDSKWNGIGFVCSSDLKPRKMLSWKCYGIERS